MGACLLATEKSFQAAVPQLCGLAKALRAEAGDDSLLLHIDATTGKFGHSTLILGCSLLSQLFSQSPRQRPGMCMTVMPEAALFNADRLLGTAFRQLQ